MLVRAADLIEHTFARKHAVRRRRVKSSDCTRGLARSSDSSGVVNDVAVGVHVHSDTSFLPCLAGLFY